MSQRFHFPIIGLFFLAAACDGFSLSDYDPRREMVVEATEVKVFLSSADSLAAPDGLYRALAFDDEGERSGEGFVEAPLGTMYLPTGRSSLLFHTFGTESSRIRNDLVLDSAAVTLPLAELHRELYDAALGRPRGENEADRDSAEIRRERLHMASYPVVWEPDAMWLATTSVDVPRRIVGEEDFVVEAELHPLVRQTFVTLGGVGGTSNISSAVAYVCGVGGAVDAQTGKVTTPCATLFQMLRHEDGLMGRFTSFGPVEGEQVKLIVVLTDVASGLWLYVYDLEGDTLDETVSLTSDMDVPAPKVEPTGGFLPVIDDWNSTIIPVKL